MEDNNKSEVEKALEDIFNEPFLTIDEEKKTKSYEKKVSYEDSNEKIKLNKYQDDDDEKVYEEKPVVEEKVEEPIKEESVQEPNYANYNYEESTERKDIFEDPYVVDTANKTTKYGLYAILSLVLIFITATAFILIKTNQEKIVECTFNARDEGYKITDSYIIAHKNGNLTYIQGEYNYVAVNDEYKKQLEYIKEEKLPVIINSNGMAGFTHVLETTNEYVKIYSYYDVTKIDFKVVDKNNEKTTPLSYIGLKSTMTFKKLESKLKKEGYICKKHN